MRFDVESGRTDRRGTRPRAEATTRVLVLADLMGAGGSGAPPIPDRPFVAIDVDRFDEALADLAPTVSLAALGVDAPLRVTALDDFHPDHLVERVPVFDRLRDIRRRLQEPATFKTAAAELGAVAPSSETPAATAPPSQESAESAFARLLGGAKGPAADTRRGSSDASDHPSVEAYIRSLVAPHVVAAADPQLPQLLSALDTALGDTMRAVLHQPALQRLEATWRGLRWLLARAEGTDEHAVEIVALHITAGELCVPATLDDLLAGRLTPRGADGAPWSLIVVDVGLGTSPGDVAMLRGLAQLAARLGVPLVASATGSVLGCQDLSTQTDHTTWTLSPEERAAWAGLQTAAGAGYLGLVWPRLLLRLPYGRRSDPIESFAFEEMPSHRHEDFLWGHGAWAAALTMVREAVNGDGEAGDIDDLPAFTYATGGETVLKACAEAHLAERAIDAILQRGVMPLASYRHRNAVRLVRLQSVAGRALPAPRSLS